MLMRKVDNLTDRIDELEAVIANKLEANSTFESDAFDSEVEL